MMIMVGIFLSPLSEQSLKKHTHIVFLYKYIKLLYSNIIQVGIFSTTGFFEWAAVRAYKYSNGDIWRLVVILVWDSSPEMASLYLSSLQSTRPVEQHMCVCVCVCVCIFRTIYSLKLTLLVYIYSSNGSVFR